MCNHIDRRTIRSIHALGLRFVQGAYDPGMIEFVYFTGKFEVSGPRAKGDCRLDAVIFLR